MLMGKMCGSFSERALMPMFGGVQRLRFSISERFLETAKGSRWTIDCRAQKPTARVALYHQLELTRYKSEGTHSSADEKLLTRNIRRQL